jgi:hypothetical protein
LWSVKTQASKKVVGCSISVTEWPDACRGRKDIKRLQSLPLLVKMPVRKRGLDRPGISLCIAVPQFSLSTFASSISPAGVEGMMREFARWNAVCEAVGIAQQWQRFC